MLLLVTSGLASLWWNTASSQTAPCWLCHVGRSGHHIPDVRFESQVSYDFSCRLSCPNSSLPPSARAFSASRETLFPHRSLRSAVLRLPSLWSELPLPRGILVLVPSALYIWPSFSPALSLVTPTRQPQADSHSPNRPHHFLCGSVSLISPVKYAPSSTKSLIFISMLSLPQCLLFPF